MSSVADFDLLILGGGCAGLSLAAALADAGYTGQVAILEPRTEYQDDRSWCFWAREQHALAGLVSNRWRQWQFSRKNRSIRTCSADGFSYQYLNSLDFYHHALGRIENSPTIRLLLGQSAGSMHRSADHVQVETPTGSLRARQVIDTRPPGPSRLNSTLLYQCFRGRVVRIGRQSGDRFDPETVELMTDMRSDRQGLQFSYVLPFTHSRALVEVTRFAAAPVSGSQLERELDQLIHRRGWSLAETERTEAGVLPMGMRQPHPEPVPGVLRAGTGGGALRAASGYGFQRIQRWAALCATRLSTGASAIAQAPDSARQRFMDQLFLQVIKDQPRLGPKLFEQMASRVPGSVFVRFMSDGADWNDCLRIISSLPPRPFLSTLMRRTPLPQPRRPAREQFPRQ